MKEMNRAGIGATFHFLPLHQSPYGRRVHGCKGRLPNTEDVCDRLLRLPIYPSLKESQIGAVVGALRKAL
jgi:dTDP-4-amino-4,6-dideoxygalactose transaminase